MKVNIRSRNQITLPEKLIKELNIGVGDDLIALVRDGRIELIPAMTIPKDEAYLFTPHWQEAIRQAEKEMSEGRLESAESVDEMIRELNKE